MPLSVRKGLFYESSNYKGCVPCCKKNLNLWLVFAYLLVCIPQLSATICSLRSLSRNSFLVILLPAPANSMSIPVSRNLPLIIIPIGLFFFAKFILSVAVSLTAFFVLVDFNLDAGGVVFSPPLPSLLLRVYHV